jgi:hypothetical protein
MVVLGCLLVIAVAGIVIGVSSSSSSRPTPRGAASLPAATSPAGPLPAVVRHLALERLMRQRSKAILSHDRKAFVATLDPGSPGFRRRQLQMLANLRRVHFSSWSYSFDISGGAAPRRARSRYDVPTWSPGEFSLHYRIAGFDPRPTDLKQYPTFVKRSGRWYLASLTDFHSRGFVSATGLWDYAPVHVVRRPGVLALGPASKLATMAAAADEMHSAIPRVTAVWGRDWARRVVLLVPATQHEMALIDSDPANLDQIAALTSSEISSSPGRPVPVGDRVTLNPANWSKVGSLGARIVLTHELTHVATRSATGSQTPKWLAEGFADYVGFLDTGVPASLAAAELGSDAQAGRLRHKLPSDRAFRGSNSALPQAYESGLLACRYLAQRYGQHKLVRFYRAVGTSHESRTLAVADSLHQLFGLTTHRFQARWRGYVVRQLG